jgi:hypothetical protein
MRYGAFLFKGGRWDSPSGRGRAFAGAKVPAGRCPCGSAIVFGRAKNKKTLIYQCFHFAKTAKIAIFGSLLLRSSCNSDKLNFYAWFMPLA